MDTGFFHHPQLTIAHVNEKAIHKASDQYAF
jgi:hypothetical protein